MQADAFWQVIDLARAAAGTTADGDTIAARVATVLATRTADEIIDFAVFLEGLEGRSYRWDLWGAAYLINGGCSDDGFDYFQGWLVTQGRAVWETAVADPDSLADVPADPEGDGLYAEDMLAAAMIAYGVVTGDEDAYWDALPDRGDGGNRGLPSEDEFDFEDADEMRRRFPRLAAIHLAAPD